MPWLAWSPSITHTRQTAVGLRYLLVTVTPPSQSPSAPVKLRGASSRPERRRKREMEASKNRKPPGYLKEVSYLIGSEVCFSPLPGMYSLRGEGSFYSKTFIPQGSMKFCRRYYFSRPQNLGLLEEISMLPRAGQSRHCINIVSLNHLLFESEVMTKEWLRLLQGICPSISPLHMDLHFNTSVSYHCSFSPQNLDSSVLFGQGLKILLNMLNVL